MATFGNTYLDIADVRRQSDRSDVIADVIEVLAQQNEALFDAPVLEANQGMSHLATIRAGLPDVTWRKLYSGVQPSKGTTTQVRDTTGMLEAWSEVDSELLRISPDPAKLRFNQAKAHIMSMAHEVASKMFYGDASVEPEKFTGLTPRFSSKSAANGEQIIDAGGTGSDNTSVWFITWGEGLTHLIYPRGTAAGLRREDLGEDTKVDATGGLFRVTRERFVQHVGLTVQDWRAVARIANVDVTNLTNDASAGADLIDLMVDAFYALDNPGRRDGNTVIYTSRTIAKYLHKQAMNVNNVRLGIEDFAGRPTVTFLGHPVRRMDALLETEAQVT